MPYLLFEYTALNPASQYNQLEFFFFQFPHLSHTSVHFIQSKLKTTVLRGNFYLNICMLVAFCDLVLPNVVVDLCIFFLFFIWDENHKSQLNMQMIVFNMGSNLTKEKKKKNQEQRLTCEHSLKIKITTARVQNIVV